MYLNPEKMASGAYCCPQSIPVEGFFTISDELTAILVENKGFVIITVAGDVVTAVKPDTAALEAWEESQAGAHQPCDPNSPCSGHEHLVTACPECGMMKTSGIPIGEVSRTATGSYVGTGDGDVTLTFSNGVPEIVFVYSLSNSGDYYGIMFPKKGICFVQDSHEAQASNIHYCVFTVNQQSIVMPYHSYGKYLNESGKTYCYYGLY